MKSVTRNLVVVTITAATLLNKGFSQTDTVATHAYDGMSLKDLLNVKIVSVSKSAESLFGAPLSASVVTRADMLRSGCTSIMEALRLVPGLIVREQSNGNYDIHLRGMDNVPPNASFDLTSNTTTLVMVDSRPIYSYLRGGTFWETLPVDLNDVERIEVVRGPAAALYGPNAVNGVINIITRQVEKKGIYVNVNNRQGSGHTVINNASIGYRFNRLSVIASGNYQHRGRSQTSYFEYFRNQYIDDPAYLINFNDDTIRNVKAIYSDPQQSMEKYAGNIFTNYRLGERSNIRFSAGLQHSLAQRVSTENEMTPLSCALSNTRYADLQGNIKGLTAQFSFIEGTQFTEYSTVNKYDFKNFNGNIEYNFTKKRFSIKPGISYQYAAYDDRKYADPALKTGMFNARHVINTQSASLRGEYKLLNNKLRFVGGLAINKFNYPDTAYLSYQLAVTWKVNKRNLVRTVYSDAPRSANVFDTYVDQTVSMVPTGVNRYMAFTLRGNKDLQLLTAKMIEAGYRSELSRTISVDAEVFKIWSKNYSLQVLHKPVNMIVAADTISMMPIMATNLPMRLEQTGITVAVTINTSRLKIKPFATLQHTQIKDYAVANTMPDIAPGAVNIYSGTGTRSALKSTPALFGGGTVDYKVGRKVNMNINSYFFTKQEYYHLSNILFNDGVHGIDQIRGKVIVNANISYEPVKGLQLHCTAKNFLNQNTREFFYTDKTPFQLLGGITYQLQ